jgi:hypothetical protein
MMFAMATAPLGQPHQLLRSIALAENSEGPKGTAAATEDCVRITVPCRASVVAGAQPIRTWKMRLLRFFEPIFYTKRTLRAKIVTDLI